MLAKGGRERPARLSPRALKYLREYLQERPKTDSDRLWVRADGSPLSYWGAQSIMRRLKERSGIKRVHWHLSRHGLAQAALVKGAHPGMVQEMLGHTTSAMTRKYLGQVKQTEAARQMPSYAPIREEEVPWSSLKSLVHHSKKPLVTKALATPA